MLTRLPKIRVPKGLFRSFWFPKTPFNELFLKEPFFFSYCENSWKNLNNFFFFFTKNLLWNGKILRVLKLLHGTMISGDKEPLFFNVAIN